MEVVRLVIFARLPQPGMVKTRLIPALGETGAAELYRRLLDHTLAEARASGLPLELRVTGGEIADFRQIFGDDFDLVEQGEGDLGERLGRVTTPAIIIGSDCPGISAPILRAAADALDERPVVLGPATDGGYYLIGHREPVPFLFENMAWSTPSVFAETLSRLAARGIGPAVLPELADIDTPEDLASWPELQ